MIEQIMYFLLGLLTAALATIALLPALWRRAVRLTRAQLEATLPLSPDEIAAEKDQIRAGYVVELRRLESRHEAAEAAAQALKADLGTRTTAIQIHEATIAEQGAAIISLKTELEEARTRIGNLELDIDGLESTRQKLSESLSGARAVNQTLSDDFASLNKRAEEQQVRLASAEADIERLNGRLNEALSRGRQLQEESHGKSEELRQAARKLREAASQISIAMRKLEAAEKLADERQHMIAQLQDERLELIDRSGEYQRERDRERADRHAIQSQFDNLTRQITTSTAEAETTRGKQSDLVRELTRSADILRNEKRQADEEVSRLRLERTMLESEVLRLRRALSAPQDITRPAPAAPPPAAPAAPVAVPAAAPAVKLPPLPAAIGSPLPPSEASDRT